MRRFNKRGMDDKMSYLIWEMIVIAMVTIVLVMAVKGIANNTTYWKKYHSTDLAMMTDVMLTTNGDFDINYNLKEMHSNWVTKMLNIDELKFQIFLKKNSYSVYSHSIDDDRFPQNYIFAENNKVNIIQSNVTKEYLTLKKIGDTFSMQSGTVVESCPIGVEDDKRDLELLKFKVLGSDDTLTQYSNYIDALLGLHGRSDDATQELFIGLIPDTDDADSSSEDSSSGSSSIIKIFYEKDERKSERMACLIKKNIKTTYPDKTVMSKEYDKTSKYLDSFKTDSENYDYWIIIGIKIDDITKEDFGTNIDAAITEYYS